MRKIGLLAIMIVAGIYAAGYVRLNAAGVNDLLAEMEAHSSRGDVDAVCAMFDDRIDVSLDDRTPDGPMQLTGSKPELCAYLQQVIPLQAKMVARTKIQRDPIQITRDWKHPWTVQAAYRERRSVTIRQPSAVVNMQSHDQLTVVQTLQGRKIIRLHSVSGLADETQV